MLLLRPAGPHPAAQARLAGRSPRGGSPPCARASREIAAELLDAVPVGTPFDLMARYAFPLPVQVICELLGVPADDRDRFGAWSTP